MQTALDMLHAVTSTAAGLQACINLILIGLRLVLLVESHLPYCISQFVVFTPKLSVTFRCSGVDPHKRNMVVKHLIVFLSTSVI